MQSNYELNQQQHSNNVLTLNENELNLAKPSSQLMLKKHKKSTRAHSVPVAKLSTQANFAASYSSSPSASSPSSSSASSQYSAASPYSASASPVLHMHSSSHQDESPVNDCVTTPNKLAKVTNLNGCFLFENLFLLQKMRDYLGEKLEEAERAASNAYSPVLSMNNALFEIDTIG